MVMIVLSWCSAMFYHWPNGDDRSKLVFGCFIIGQMAMIVLSWCSAMFYHWPNDNDRAKLVFGYVLSLTK